MIKGYIPKSERKTILFLADDMRLSSGIGTMTRELIIGNAHRYNFVHVGAAINHPEAGKALDLSADINKETGLLDSSVLLYPYNGYGDPDLIRYILTQHKIDTLVHFTDPRYWIWLYEMSAEIRQKCPIVFYTIWDDVPYPHYNRPYYESCDLLMAISKQTKNIVKQVLIAGDHVNVCDLDDLVGWLPNENKQTAYVSYVPHGINTKYFKKLERSNTQVQEMRNKLFNGQNPKFVLFYNNRNIRRKMTSDILLGFKLFHDKLPKSEQSGVKFVLHTQAVDENGTDLPTTINTICPEIKDKIIFTDNRLSPEDLCILYNCCDVVINVGSNEGWGLSSTEGLLTGRVLINNVTGGLQDQCRFEDEDGNWINFTKEFSSNHTGKYTKHGAWVKPVFPSSISLQGSIPTPYIFDDRCDIRDIAKAILYWYNVSDEERTKYGQQGYNWATSQEAGFTAEMMCEKFSSGIDHLLQNWVAPHEFIMYSADTEIQRFNNNPSGITLHI